ncbi:putative G/U mismatch-specific DNA glycosylase [Firmicutes bacterium CAG:822]|nr:putative G/U mismatch-specific DNA glycosylase [Firmicutes bacterium CAG:822]
MQVSHEFGPYINKDSKVLILGSIPSVKSRELGFYYMHPQNRFWKLMSDLLNEDFPNTIEDRKEFLKRNNIALWDVLDSCDINGSSDSSIKNPKVNDIKKLIQGTDVKYIFVTGKKALELYNKYCYNDVLIKAIYLPSTSGANCAFSYGNLKSKYKILIKYLKKE